MDDNAMNQIQYTTRLAYVLAMSASFVLIASIVFTPIVR
jgi:hypothetical protein